MSITVVGAGMAGLLAAGMLMERCDAVFEAQSALPNNHSAVLRFRTSVVGDALNIPFKEVRALRAVHPWRNPVADALSYSIKTNGCATLRSIQSANGDLAARYVAPPDFVRQMADRVGPKIAYDVKFDFSDAGPVISTIPMPALMAAMDYPRRHQLFFRSRSGSNLVAQLQGVDAYCSIYVPDPGIAAARISIMGDVLVAESYGGREPELHACLSLMGLDASHLDGAPEVKEQRYAKILPIDEDERRRFIMWASERGVYSLGRFATWRPNLLLDDVVNDVRVIQRLISNRAEAYAHNLKG